MTLTLTGLSGIWKPLESPVRIFRSSADRLFAQNLSLRYYFCLTLIRSLSIEQNKSKINREARHKTLNKRSKILIYFVKCLIFRCQLFYNDFDFYSRFAT